MSLKERSKKKTKKAKTKYKNIKYPGLKLSVQSRLNREFVDYDYIDQLSPDEKAFLSKFTQEQYSGTFEKNEDDTYSYDNFDPKIYKGNLARNDKERRESYERNNKKLKDVHGQITAFSSFTEYDTLAEKVNPQEAIDNIIDISIKDPESLKYKPARKKSTRNKRTLPKPNKDLSDGKKNT
jgi:hypothetical protein